VRGPKNGLQQMPPNYNTYEAKTLSSKFCKDKQNWSSETGLLKLGRPENSFGDSLVSKLKGYVWLG
jgi:hypothetical protein